MIRAMIALGLPAAGLSGKAAPVAGLTRTIESLRTGFEPRTLWARSEPPWAVGEVIGPPVPAGGSPQGFFGVGLPVPPPKWP